MTCTTDQLERWMDAPEDEHLEFKEARNHFDFEDLVKYCCALANEHGGRMILGVTDRRPRQVVGTTAFAGLERTKAGLVERLRIRVDAEEVLHPNGRVIVFQIPGRPVGVPVGYKGAYWMRGGESLVPMTPDMLKRIFAETQPDFSAQPCPGAKAEDLDPAAVGLFRKLWGARSQRSDLEGMTPSRMLEDAELLVDGSVTYAALVMMGTRKALGRHLADAELIFEFRSDESQIGYQHRCEYREGFLQYHNELWTAIDSRNEIFRYQIGFLQHDVRAFNEAAVREAILNAVSHRDYRIPGSSFVRQWPTKIEITSPGGFPPEITPENILFRQSPRNRRIAEALAKCGLVERSGQGVDRMFETAVREGKLPPDFSGSDRHRVQLILHGKVQDERFLLFLERIGQETQRSFGVDDLLVIDAVHRSLPVPGPVQERIPRLLELGAIERTSQRRLVLSQRFYSMVGKRGEYTRRKGLTRKNQKALLLQHLEESTADGAPLRELCGVLPSLAATQVQHLLRELKTEGLVHTQGRTRQGRWFWGPQETDKTRSGS